VYTLVTPLQDLWVSMDSSANNTTMLPQLELWDSSGAPTWFSPRPFSEDTFDAEAYVSSMKFVPLDLLKKQLENYLKDTRQRLSEAIYEDYGECAKLPGALKGVDGYLARTSGPLKDLRVRTAKCHSYAFAS